MFLPLLFSQGNSASQSSASVGVEVVLPKPEDILGCFLTDYLTQVVSKCSIYYASNGTNRGLNTILRAAVASCMSDTSSVNKVWTLRSMCAYGSCC